MDKAIEVIRGEERTVSATEIKRRFAGRTPYGVRFICPFCRQKLFPSAMKVGSKQAPHFKHERDNERAHQCEMYASFLGSASAYQKAALPMFIRPSRDREGVFIIEGGFRQIDPGIVSSMQREGASLLVGSRQYKISSQRFGHGMVRIPFEDVCLDMSTYIRIAGSRQFMETTWGKIEPAKNAMVFLCDPDSMQGKRLKSGESIEYESYLLFATKAAEKTFFEAAFPDAELLGYAGSKVRGRFLLVYGAKVVKGDAYSNDRASYLKRCGFGVEEVGGTPFLLWPPALSSSGENIPLFKNSCCLFGVSKKAASKGRIYIYSRTDSLRGPREIPLRHSFSDIMGYAVFRSRDDVCFVSSYDEGVCSDAILLCPREAMRGLRPREAFPEIEWRDEGMTFLCRWETACFVHHFKRKTRELVRYATGESTPVLEFKVSPGDCVRVFLPQWQSRSNLIIADYVVTGFAGTSSGDDRDSGGRCSRVLLSRTVSAGKRRALGRAWGRRCLRVSKGKLHALRRGVQ